MHNQSIQYANSGRPTDGVLVGVLMLFFFACLLPFVVGFIKHHPDERHYTDAAIKMIKSGDYLTPRTLEGELRLKKPLLPYWLVTAGYQAGGVSPVTSRLPFLLLGTITIWLSYQLAYQLFEDRKVCFLAACATALQPSLIISSMRSIPDILLTCAILCSSIGFIRLYKTQRHDWPSILLAYIGLSCAIQSKGLPAMVFGVLAIAILAYTRGRQVIEHLAKHALGLSLTAVLGFAWFLLMYWKHQELFLMDFFGDQVSARLRHSFWMMIPNGINVFSLMVLSCLPWLFVLFNRKSALLRLKAFRSWRFDLEWLSKALEYMKLRPDLTLVIAWVAIYLLLASCVDRVNVRYQAPIAPFAACLAAYLVGAMQEWRLNERLARLALFSAFAVIAAASFVAATSFVFVGDNLLSICLLAASGVIALVTWRVVTLQCNWRRSSTVGTINFLSLSLAAYVAFDTFAYSKFESKVISEYYTRGTMSAPIAVMTTPADCARLNVQSAATVPIEFHGNSIEMLRSHQGDIPHDVMLISMWETFHLDLREYDLVSVPDGYWNLSGKELFHALLAGKASAYLKQHEQTMVLATRKPTVLWARKIYRELDEKHYAERSNLIGQLRSAVSPSHASFHVNR